MNTVHYSIVNHHEHGP